MVSVKENYENFKNFHLLLAAIIVLWFNSGVISFFQSFAITLVVKIGAAVLWFAIATMRDESFLHRYIKVTLPLWIYFVCVFIFSKITVANYQLITTVTTKNVAYMLIMCGIFVFYYANDRIGESKVILFIWLTDIVICGIITIQKLSENPQLSRYLSTGDPTKYIRESVIPKGVLSFGNAYGIMLVTAILLFAIYKLKEKERIITACIIAYLVFLIFKMQFTICILLLLLCLIFMVCNNISNNHGKSIVLIVVPLVSFLIFFFLPQILSYLIEVTKESKEICNRLQEIRAFVSQENIAGTDMMNRFKSYLVSIKTSFGTGFIGAIICKDGSVGGHSELFDTLALYGIIPFTALVTFFVKLSSYVKSKLHSEAKSIINIIYCIFLIVSMINTSLWCTTMQSLTVIIPLYIIYFDNKFFVPEKTINENNYSLQCNDSNDSETVGC